MLLNRLEFALMNNPVRAALQRHVEAARFLRLGGPVPGGRVLEVGCGRGVGAALILERFGAAAVDAFDLDPRMIARAHRRLRARGGRVRLWVGDVAALALPADTYDAAFDFGIIHHVPAWPKALAEIQRVLKPGGRFYAVEPLGRWINHPLIHRLCAHPAHERFDAPAFRAALGAAGLRLIGEDHLWHMLFWFVAAKPGPAPAGP